MAKKLSDYTFINGTHCLTETDYKGYKIYKVNSRGLEYYQVLVDNKLKGMHFYLKYAKKYVDTITEL